MIASLSGGELEGLDVETDAGPARPRVAVADAHRASVVGGQSVHGGLDDPAVTGDARLDRGAEWRVGTQQELQRVDERVVGALRDDRVTGGVPQQQFHRDLVGDLTSPARAVEGDELVR